MEEPTIHITREEMRVVLMAVGYLLPGTSAAPSGQNLDV